MFNTINEFVQEFEKESATTQRVLDSLTDESLQQKISDNHRSLGQIAWHLVTSIHYMTFMGLTFDESLTDEGVPSSAAKISSEYRRIGQSMLRAVKVQWTDESLKQTVNMMGEDWENSASLRYTLSHEIHHRGQMTVLMRQAGLRVPNVLGPTRDDWIDKGMEPYA